MKKYIFILIIILLCAQASALDSKTVAIQITINKPPSIGTFTPVDGNVVSEGDTLEISVTATDPNNDILQYRFFVNGAIKRDWGTASSFNYVLGTNDVGLNKIKAQITDNMLTVETDEVEVYAFRNTVETPQ